jgi:glyoxylase-like metal-dependent hydrolase (beta-lactamase superfamily II)
MMKIQELENNKLILRNSGNLSLFFIGVGSAFSKLNNQTNLMIIKGNDHLLVDCGTKCSQALAELGIGMPEIETFLVTHSHADHIGGLEEAALIGRYMVKRRPKMVINKEYQKILWDMSLSGGCAYGEGDGTTRLGFEDFWEPLRPKPMKGKPRQMMEVNVGSINIKLFRTCHFPDLSKSWETSFWSCGLIIDDRVLFTSDTRFDPDMVTTLDGMFHFENIFHDCQFYPGGVHAYIEDLITLPADIRRRIFLSHFGDNWIKFEDRVAQSGFAGFARQQVFYNYL